MGCWGSPVLYAMNIDGYRVYGVQKIAKFATLSGMLNISLVLFVIFSDFTYLAVFHHPATIYTLRSLLPEGSIFDNISNLALLMFALGSIRFSFVPAPSLKTSHDILIYELGLIGSQ